MSNNTSTNRYLLLISTMFSTIILATSVVPSLLPTSAFAEPDGDGVVVDPTTQTSVETSTNINVDHDVSSRPDVQT